MIVSRLDIGSQMIQVSAAEHERTGQKEHDDGYTFSMTICQFSGTFELSVVQFDSYIYSRFARYVLHCTVCHQSCIKYI